MEPEVAAGRFAVLGPLVVTDSAGNVVPLRSVTRRRLLGLLLTRPGEVHLAERLIDQVWFEDPPLGRGAFHIQVSRLRKDLNEAGGLSRIVTEPGGYRLHAATEEIDAARFTQLVEAARSSAVPNDAITSYAQALALWRGDAFEDLLGPPAIEEYARHLDLMRRAATVEHATLLSRTGRREEAIARLDPLHRETPFDESVTTGLARSLAAVGRRDQALATIEKAKRAFREQLGLDPPLSLETLHLQLLEPGPIDDDSPDLGIRGPSEFAFGTAGPALPVASNNHRFLGRVEEVARVTEVATHAVAARCLAVTGPSGIGKTTVAVRVATELRSAGGHVRFASCAASPTLVGHGLRTMFADLLGTRPPVHGAMGDRFTSAEIADALVGAIGAALDDAGVAGPLTLVIDDLHLADDVDIRTLDGLLGIRGRRWFTVVIATSRRRPELAGAPVDLIRLANLSIEEISAGVGDRSVAEAVMEVTAGHPFAVGQVLDLMDRGELTRAANEIVGLLSAANDQVPMLSSARQLSSDGERALRLLAVADGPIDPLTLAAAVSGRSSETAMGAVIELIDAGMAIERSDGALSITHELLAAQTRGRLGGATVQQLKRRLLAATSADDPWAPSGPGLVAAAGERHGRLVRIAGSAAALGAFEEAERIAGIVLDSTTEMADRMSALLLVGQCRSGLADDTGAHEAFAQAFELASRTRDQDGLAESLTGLIGAWNAGSGPSPELNAYIESALSDLHEPAPRAVALARSVGAHLGSGPHCRAWADEATRLAEACRDPRAVAAAAYAHSQANLGWPGAAERFERTGEAARSAPLEIGYDRYGALISHHFVAAVELDELDVARWCVERQRWIAEATRRPLHRWRAHVLQATESMAAGRLDVAAREIDAAASVARAHRLTDGRMTELLQRAALRCWGSSHDPLDHGYRPIGPAAPHPLAYALDAVVLAESDPETARSSLALATAGVAGLPNDYLRWATIAALRCAAQRHDDSEALALANRLIAAADVRLAVLAVGTAALPTA